MQKFELHFNRKVLTKVFSSRKVCYIYSIIIKKDMKTNEAELLQLREENRILRKAKLSLESKLITFLLKEREKYVNVNVVSPLRVSYSND